MTSVPVEAVHAQDSRHSYWRDHGCVAVQHGCDGDHPGGDDLFPEERAASEGWLGQPAATTGDSRQSVCGGHCGSRPASSHDRGWEGESGDGGEEGGVYQAAAGSGEWRGNGEPG